MVVGFISVAAVLSFLQTTLAFLVVIAIIAGIHEGGHFAVAKAAGVKVYEFSIGIGHKIWGRQYGETLYSLRWIPLGAFVKPAGMNPDEDEEYEGVTDLGPRGFNNKHFLTKNAILLGGPGANIFLTIAITATLFNLDGAQDSSILVQKLVSGKPAEVAGVLPGDIVTALDGIPVRDYREGIAYIHERGGIPIRFTIRRHDLPERTVVLDSPIPESNASLVPTSEGILIEVFSTATATVAQGDGEPAPPLRPGDRILSIGGKAISDLDNPLQAFRDAVTSPSAETALEVLPVRQFDLTITPEAQSGTGTGLVGIHIQRHRYGKVRPVSLGRAIKEGVGGTLAMTAMIYTRTLGLLSISLVKMEVPDEVGGPIMIASEVGKGARRGWRSLIELTALLSLFIGVFNLLPIPGLDGGRIFLLFVKSGLNIGYRVTKGFHPKEDILGPRGEEAIHLLGFVFLLFLIIVVSWKDVRVLMSE